MHLLSSADPGDACPISALQIETPKADPSRITKGWTAPKLPEFKPELKVGAPAFHDIL